MINAAMRHAVLVVDDEPQVLRAIEDTLEDSFQVYAETSPEVAIHLIEELPDLSVILSDQRMPGISGDEFLAKAREMSDATRLLITGYADLDAVIRAVNLGKIFGYISKPWNPDHLKLAVFKAVEHYDLVKNLSTERELLHQLMDNSPDLIFFKDLNHRLIRVNAAHAAAHGFTRPEDAVGRTVFDYMSAERAHLMEAQDEELVRTGVPIVDRIGSAKLPTGEVRWHSITKAPIRDHRGEITGLVGIVRDITERKKVEEQVLHLNRLYAVLSGINSTIVRVRTRDELFREVCRIAVEAGQFRFAWIGVIDREKLEVKPVAHHGHENGFLRLVPTSLRDSARERPGMVSRAISEKRALIANDIEGDPKLRVRQEALARSYRSVAVLPLQQGDEVTGVFVLFAAESGFFDDEEMKLLQELAGDIAFALDHIEKEEKLNYLAFYDALTGLANRDLFCERLTQQMLSAAQEQQELAVLMIDVERFKRFNDTLGRQAGDQLLKQIAERIDSVVGDPSRHARLGADQFAALVPRVQVEGDIARRVEQRLREIFGPPYRIDDTELRVSAKVGVAVFPDDGADAEALLQSAEAALKQAKAMGERYLFFRPQMSARIAEKLALENKLRQALEKDQFVLHYQPRVDLQSGEIEGVEALIRWMNPELGMVPPGEFIPLMEETGLILDVGAWAMRRAVFDHRSWLDQGLAAPRIAVNVSAIQLRKRDFVEVVKDALGQGASPAGLDLEITESLIMEDLEGNIEKFKALNSLGVNIAIDDFGTGYSSLGYLAKLPVQTLKIDRSFIIAMADDPDAMTLVSTIISLAHALRLKVVAEGVDSEEQAKLLRLLRCAEMQGYLFSRPLPLAEMTTLLKKRRT